MTVNWPKCMAILLTKGPWVGFGFHRCLHIQGCFAIGGTITETPSNGILLFDRTGWPHLPWHWCNPKRSSNILPDGTFLVLFYWIFSGDGITWLHGWALLPLPCYGAKWSTNKLCPMHCRARLGEQYNCDSIQVTINGDTSRCQWACHQFLLNALAFSVFWSPPDVVHHWGCRLASLHRGSSTPGGSGRLAIRAPASAEASTVIPPPEIQP